MQLNDEREENIFLLKTNRTKDEKKKGKSNGRRERERETKRFRIENELDCQLNSTAFDREQFDCYSCYQR